jgi:hypothetical protein
MYIICRANAAAYLYGNKTFTFARKSARTFSSWSEANSHITSWFENGTCNIEQIDGPLEERN